MKKALIIFSLFFYLISVQVHASAMGFRGASSPPQKRKLSQLSGQIISFTPPILVIKTQTKNMPIKIGPRWYWKQLNYQLQPGQQVKIYGYSLNNYFVPVEILSKNKRIQLRDEQGFPLWRHSKLFNSGRARGDYGGNRRRDGAGRGGNRGGGSGEHGGGNHGGESGGRGGGNHGGESGGRGGGGRR